MADPSKPSKKVANSLVALSSAAVLAVYAAGYVRTRSAADRFALQASGRRLAGDGVRLPSTALGPGQAAADPSGIQLQPDPDPGAVQLQLGPDSGSVRVPPYADPSSVPLQPDLKKPATVRLPSTALGPRKPDTTVESSAPAPAEAPAPVVVAEQQAPEPAVAPAAPPKSEYKDGTYLGWGHCRHGDIQASVVIAAGRIASATIAQCLTRYSCSVIEKLPPEVAQRQSPDVDSISGATQSGDAFYYAVLDALYQAK